MAKSEVVRAVQTLLGVAVDGKWGSATNAAFNASSAGFQQQVNKMLATVGLSVAKILDYQAQGGDESKEKFRSVVVPTVRKLAEAKGLNSDIMIAQLSLESGGGGRIPKGSNNWGGIKARAGDKVVRASTKEGVGGVLVKAVEGFKAYDTPEQFAEDYVNRLASSKRYAKAYKLMDNRLAAKAIKDAGYATDPNYVSKLVNVADKLLTA